MGWIKQPAAQGQHRFFERYKGYKKNIGGEGGIRTLDELLTHTPLAGERLRPLGHLSGDIADLPEISKNGALGGSRTPDLLVRSQTLYPAELPARRGRIIEIHVIDLQRSLWPTLFP